MRGKPQLFSSMTRAVSSSTPIQLRAIRLVHTAIWVFFVVIILAGDRPGEVVFVLLVRALGITGGAFALRGANWARWLLVASMTYHVVISARDSAFAVAAHAMLLVVSMFVYFRAPASEWFRVRRS